MRAVHPTLLLLTAYLAVFLEVRFPLLRNVLGVQIDLLPAIMVYAGLSTDVFTVVVLAFLGGFWFDSLSANPMGVTVVPLLAVGLFLLIQRDYLLRDAPYARFIFGCLSSALVPLLSLAIMMSLGAQPLIGWGFLWSLLIMSLGGGLVTPLIFSVFERLRLLFQYQPLETVSFREDREIKRSRR